MDLRKIKKLIELVEESGIAELEVKSGDEAVRIARPAPGMAVGAPVVMPNGYALAPAAQQDAPSAIGVAASATPAPNNEPAVDIRAPMAGTFYVANEPGAAPFVATGANVAIGDVVCIIESMKMMNEIKSEHSGRLVEVLVANAEPVATGQVLMRLR